MKTITRFLLCVFAGAISFGGSAFGQGQAVKTFTHSVAVEGAGKVTLSYRSLHWNPFAYTNAKKDEKIRERLNSSLWQHVGKLESDFDLVIGGVQVPKGSYSFGINFDANDQFKLVLGADSKEITIPLQSDSNSLPVAYLTFDLRPRDNADGLTLEGRIGNFRALADVTAKGMAPQQ